MTDIADIGFRVDTAQLEKGAQGLNKLAAAAAGVDTANLKMVKLAESAGVKVAKAATDAARATLRESEATVKKLRDSKSATEQEIKAAIAIRKTAAANLDAARATEQRTRATISQNESLRQQNALAKALSIPSTVVGSVASGGRVSSSPAIVDQKIEMARAAQAASNAQYEFNALLGVNQQLEKSARSSASAFMELYKAQELAAKSAMMVDKPNTRVSGVVNGGRVALARDQMPNRFNTANIAAQFQDIGVTAAMGMNPMTIALQQGTQLSAIMNSMQNPLKGIADAFRSIFNATSLLAIGFVAVIAALIQFADWTKIGQSVLNGLAASIEYLVPLLAGLAAGFIALNFSTIIAGATSLFGVIAGLGPVLALAAKAAWAFSAALLANPITWIVAGVTALVFIIGQATGAFDGAADAVRGWARDLVQANNDVNNLSKSINEQTIDLHNQITAMRMNGKERIAFTREQELMNAAIKEYKGTDLAGYMKSIEPTIKAAARGYANMRTELDSLEEAERKRNRSTSGRIKSPTAAKEDPWEKLTGDAQRKISTMKAQQAAIGMSEVAAAKLRYETELLNEAQQKGIVLDKDKLIAIEALAAGMAETEAETARLKNAYQFLEDAGRGFISDLRSNLQEGKSLWESFGASVKNVIDKMIEEILNSQIKSIMQSIIPSGGGGAGGLLGGLASILGGAFGGGTESAIASSIAANPGIYALGGAFQNGVQKFASGGVVSSATMFGMAGGKTGVMGEAGPEAIMPLHRGPDGSLGVKTNVAGNDNSSEPAQPSVTYVINAPGASKSDLESVRQTLMALAGPGVVEQRVQMGQARGML